MYQLLFRNRWFALLWAGLTLAGISAFVSEGGGTDKLGATAQDVRQQRAMIAGSQSSTLIADEAPIVDDDAALVDPAQGFDPAPMDDTNPDGSPKLVRRGMVEQPADEE